MSFKGQLSKGQSVFEENGKYGLVSKDGNISVPAIFDSVGRFNGASSEAMYTFSDKNERFIGKLTLDGNFEYLRLGKVITVKLF